MLTTLKDYFSVVRSKIEQAADRGDKSECIRLWMNLRDEACDQIRKLEKPAESIEVER